MNIQELAEYTANVCKSEIFQLIDSEDWTDLGVKRGVKCLQRVNGDRKVLLGVSLMEFRIEVIENYLKEIKNKFVWEPLLVSSDVLLDFGDCKVMHEVFRAPWPVSRRDFVFVVKSERIGEDVLLVGKSLDAGVPEGRGVVRAECINSGFYLKKVEEFVTEVKYLVCIDPKGYIPKVFTDFAASQQLMCLNEIRKALTSIKC